MIGLKRCNFHKGQIKPSKACPDSTQHFCVAFLPPQCSVGPFYIEEGLMNDHHIRQRISLELALTEKDSMRGETTVMFLGFMAGCETEVLG